MSEPLSERDRIAALNESLARPAAEEQPGSELRILGGLIAFAGVGAAVFAWFMPISVEASGVSDLLSGVSGEVVNLAKVQTQTLVFNGGIGALLAGLALYCTGVLVGVLKGR